ncbi:MAG: YkgJ family cysteine cluster protein [Candidatus Poseidoniia archaeon]|nr:YkgJ family cysteine cluster protein [Candidatus Poseidoniia archaeon]
MAEPPKFIYDCVRCGQYCSSVDGVPVTLQDLLRWQASGELGRLVTHLGLETDSGFPRLVLKPPEGEEQGCPVYDVKTKDCGLYDDLPLNCQAYPLGYNSQKYYVVDQACQGLGEGEMTTDRLRAQRDCARNEYEARSSSAATLPVMYGLVMRELMDQSRQAMESLTPEQKAELERRFRGGA